MRMILIEMSIKVTLLESLIKNSSKVFSEELMYTREHQNYKVDEHMVQYEQTLVGVSANYDNLEHCIISNQSTED